MKNYMKPLIFVIKLETEDVITTSGDWMQPEVAQNEGVWEDFY